MIYLKMIKDLLGYIIQCCLTLVTILGFIIALTCPNINSYKREIPLVTIIFVCIFIISLIYASVKLFQKYFNKSFDFIERKQTEQGNDVYWFKSDYFLNIGDIVKLIQYSDSGTTSNLCIAKVQYKNEATAIGLLPLNNTSNLDLLKNNSASIRTLKIKPVHINTDEISQILKQIKKNASVEKEEEYDEK